MAKKAGAPAAGPTPSPAPSSAPSPTPSPTPSSAPSPAPPYGSSLFGKACRLFNRPYRQYTQGDELLRTLDLVVMSACVGTILFANTTGAALTGYASALGAGDLMFGLFAALPILGSLAQLFASNLIEKTGKRKALFMAGGIAQRTAWIAAAFVPYMLPQGAALSRLWALLGLITFSSASGALVNVTHTTMVAEVVPIGIRGRFVATRQRMVTLFSMAAGLGASFVLDYTRGRGLAGYTAVFAVGGACGVADILMYARFRFPAVPRAKKSLGFAAGVRECFRTHKTRQFLMFWTVWSFAANISTPFVNKYALVALGLSFRQIILFGQIAANVASVIVVSRWGRFIDRYGCAPLLLLTGSTTALLSLVWLPASPGSVAPLLAFNLVGGFVWCANEACAANMQLSHTPDIGRPLTIAIYAIITSVSTAVASIVGGLMLEWLGPVMEGAGLTFFGSKFDHYKALFSLSSALRMASVLVFVPSIWNEKGLSPREAYADLARRAKAWAARARLTLAQLPQARRAWLARSARGPWKTKGPRKR